MNGLYLGAILACAVQSLAALSLAPVDIPGIEAGPVNPLTGATASNFRHADMDGDGQLDLLLPNHLVVGHDGSFDTASPIPLPGADEQPQADLWKDHIYMMSADRWRVIHLEDGRWVEDVAHARVDSVAGVTGAAKAAQQPGYRWMRFLYDFDVDGQPEIVLARPDGVHVLRMTSEGVAPLAVLDVLPAMTLAHVPDQTLWPPEDRRLVYPGQQLDCRLLINATRITVITREPLSNGRARFRSVPYRLDISLGSAFLDDRGVVVTPPMPDYMQPCQLNQDPILDFAGGDWEYSTTRVLPVPLHTTAASTDGGQTIHTVRTQSYSPRSLFVDFDGDDRLDLVAESAGLYRGGLRESLSRQASDRIITHQIAIYPQTINGVFADAPAVRASFKIELSQVPMQQGEMLRLYQGSELFNVTGDFDGNGRNDFAVRDRADRVAIFLSTLGGRSQFPEAELEVDAPVWRFGVADVNLDGRADLLIESGAASSRKTVVYLTLGIGP